MYAFIVSLGLAACVGDCNLDGRVHIDELLTSVRVELGENSLEDCAAIDCNNGVLQVNCLVAAINNALRGCSIDQE